MRTLRCAAAVEAASLVLLLANLLTVHTEAVASLGGPVHGTAYLIVILAVRRACADPTARWQAWIPGIGGLLALRQLNRNPARGRCPDPLAAPRYEDGDPSARLPAPQQNPYLRDL
ncbi:DUF3817 domain-containing protein [Streptomyces yangpuensis]|uniref:DUF3817 domain-containing protein n=1 Tax=Streptomyces yangpuensis TaxID=1648182 RepID=UPI00365181FC